MDQEIIKRSQEFFFSCVSMDQKKREFKDLERETSLFINQKQPSFRRDNKKPYIGNVTTDSNIKP